MSKSPSLRRIQADIRELALDPSDRYSAAPLENDMFEWHFTIKGADETDFQGGIYHGRILLPPEYPFKPPHIIFLTPTGRFDINTKVCLSFSAYHPELWQPAWGIRLILEALISFLPTPADGAIGALDWTSTERKKLAIKSQSFCCPQCGPIKNLIPPLKTKQSSSTATASSGTKTVFQKQIEELQRLQQLAHAKPIETTTSTDGTVTSTEEQQNEQQQHVEKGTTWDTDTVRDDDTKEPAVTSDNDHINKKEVVGGDVTIIPSGKEEAAEQAEDVTTSEPVVVLEEDKPIPTPANEVIDESLPKKTSAALFIEEQQQKQNNGTNNPTAEEQQQQQHEPQQQPAAAAAPQNNNNNNTNIANTATSIILSTKFLDPFLQGIILLLSIICYLLLRKIQSLVADIQALEYSSSNTE